MNILIAAAIAMTLAWTPPTTNEDGSPLTDLAGHKMYLGTESGLYSVVVDVGMETNGTFENLSENITYYFAVTAYDLAGNESDFSLEITNLVELKPDPGVIATVETTITRQK